MLNDQFFGRKTNFGSVERPIFRLKDVVRNTDEETKHHDMMRDYVLSSKSVKLYLIIFFQQLDFMRIPQVCGLHL